MQKCTFCFEERTSKGKPPACVAACPTQAMTYGKRADLLAEAKKRLARHPDRYVPPVYGEKIVGGTLSVVPAVILLWPTFLGGVYALTRRRAQVAKEEKRSAAALAREREAGSEEEAK